MEYREMIINIIVPIISSIIGGSITIIGVLISIKHENKKIKRELELQEKSRKDELRIKNEPLFYILDPLQDYDNKNAIEFNFVSNEPRNGKTSIIFKNTDKAHMILDHVSFNDKLYFPSNGIVVDKNKVFYIHIFSQSDLLKEKNNEIYLTIKDILNNTYKYKINYSSEKRKFISGLLEKVE